MLLIVIIIALFLAVGGGYLGHNRFGSSYPYAGGGIGIGTILVILLICWLLGLFR